MAVSGRKVRQVVAAQGEALNQLAAVLRTLEQRERDTRKRVEGLAPFLSAHAEILGRDLWGRLRWLFRGN